MTGLSADGGNDLLVVLVVLQAASNAMAASSGARIKRVAERLNAIPSKQQSAMIDDAGLRGASPLTRSSGASCCYQHPPYRCGIERAEFVLVVAGHRKPHCTAWHRLLCRAVVNGVPASMRLPLQACGAPGG
ncbi:hypothetical protein [Xanthomonas arboricola]|uniref:Uncharacterized protein n=1 Tax=Xanthomonas arboricola TaxID=56448 RepID=A0AB73GY85_9XANT|nr:hypothetical protein [Xanthomonas arboricola]